MDCVSLFSGAGGLDLGFRAAGFTTLAAVEIDPDSCRTLKINGFKHVACNDVGAWLEENRQLRPNVLIGGPPCQPFSKSAYWNNSSAKGLADERAGCLATFLAAVEALQPKCFLIENVPGFVTAGGVGQLQEALERLRNQGQDYHFNWSVLNCADYGVPQKRERFFGIGSLIGPISFPRPTHARDSHATAWDALRRFRGSRTEDLRPKGKWADLLPSIPEGCNYLWHTARGGGQELFGWRTRYWSFLQKLSKADAAPTIVATPAQEAGPFHWTNRQLSTSELAALQTFPRSHQFSGNRASRRRQIGNAVPPLMGEILAREIANHLGFPRNGELTHAIERSNLIPAPAAVRPMPMKYHSMVGEHAAHPGTGKGPSPRQSKLRVGGLV